MKDIISINDFSREDLDFLIEQALQLKLRGSQEKIFSGKKIASLFFEDSTRTRESFETAAKNLGLEVNGFSGTEGTSVKKGECLADTIRMYAGYHNQALILRHPLEGSTRLAADLLDIPVINGGDGSNSHPTQTMLDLVTIKETRGTIDGLNIAFVGDLKYGRTVHSLLQALQLYDVQPWLIAPEQVKMPSWRIQDYQSATGKQPFLTADLQTALNTVDVIYMTRIQRERFQEGPEGDLEYKKVSGIYRLTAEMLKDAKEDLIILHPLPRYKHNLEISLDIDQTKHAAYLQQAQNGLHLRQALLHQIFSAGFTGRKKPTPPSEPLWQDLPIPDGKKRGENFLYRLDNGTLIDHIEPGKGSAVLKVLGLKDYQETPLVSARNLRSSRYGKKDVIGIHHHELSEEQLSRLALVTPHATVNIIRDKTVYRKGKVNLPPQLDHLILCQNHGCISHPDHDEHTPTRFYLESRDPLELRCHYCENPLSQQDIRLL